MTNPTAADLLRIFETQQANQWNVKASSADVRKAKLAGLKAAVEAHADAIVAAVLEDTRKPEGEIRVTEVLNVTAKHGLLGLCRTIAKEGGPKGVRTNVICPGFVRTPLVDKQIPEQAKELGISEDEVIRKVMLGQTVDGEFTTVDDIAELALFFEAFPSNALTGQSLVASHGW